MTEEIAQSLGITDPVRGALVAGVDERGPAKTAGIEPGDVIIAIDGNEIGKARDLARFVAARRPGEQVAFIILRKGKEQTRIVSLGDVDEPALGRKPSAIERKDALLRGAEANDAAAMSRLGDFYFEGEGVAKDEGEARLWYRKAAERGDLEGMASLGWMYQAGAAGPSITKKRVAGTRRRRNAAARSR